MQYPYTLLVGGLIILRLLFGPLGKLFDALMERAGNWLKDRFVSMTLPTKRSVSRAFEKNRNLFSPICHTIHHMSMQVPTDGGTSLKINARDLMRHKKPERENRLHLLAALAMCENIDWNVGRCLRN